MIRINGTAPLDLFKGGGVDIQKTIVQDLFGLGHVELNNEYPGKSDKQTVEKGGLGLAVWGSVTLADGWKGTGKGYHKNGVFHPLEEMYIPCCIVDASGTNNIIKTEIQGSTRRGTIKEYISEGDYSVSIKGILCSEDDKWPDQLVLHLTTFCLANVAIPVNNKLLSRLGINSLVIESVKWPSKQGYKNLQPFELNCISDEDFEFEYYTNKKLEAHPLQKK